MASQKDFIRFQQNKQLIDLIDPRTIKCERASAHRVANVVKATQMRNGRNAVRKLMEEDEK